jgi:hypothetical protein
MARGGRERLERGGVRGYNGGGRQYQFRVVELTCGALGTDQNLTPHIIRLESQGDTQLSVRELGEASKIWEVGRKSVGSRQEVR